MASLSDLYTHLKTLCEQWFYNKSQIDSQMANKINKSSTSGLVKNDGSIDTNTYLTSASLSGYEQTTNKTSSWNSTVNNTRYPTEKLVKDSLDGKLDNKLGSQPEKPLITGANGYVELGSFGTTSGTFAEGDHTHTGTYAPTSHTQASSTITDSNTYSHIGNASATQESINSAIDTAIGNLQSINAIEVVTTKPTASASTMGKLYIVKIRPFWD